MSATETTGATITVPAEDVQTAHRPDDVSPSAIRQL
jgi:hypothetical protein